MEGEKETPSRRTRSGRSPLGGISDEGGVFALFAREPQAGRAFGGLLFEWPVLLSFYLFSFLPFFLSLFFFFLFFLFLD